MQNQKLSNSKVAEILQNLVKYYKDKTTQKICNELSYIFQNRNPDLSYHFTQINVEHQQVRKINQNHLQFQIMAKQKQKTLKTLHDTIWFTNLTQEQKEIYNYYTEFLSKFVSYYVEREKFGSNIVNEFKSFFISAGNLIQDENTKMIFRFATKLILREYSRVVKSFKKKAKDGLKLLFQFFYYNLIEQSLKQATQVEKQLAEQSIAIISELLRCVNIKGAQDLKLLVSNQQMKIHFMLYQFDRAAACDKPANERGLLDISNKCDIITYYYYRGRISIFNSNLNFSEASSCLQKVLEACPNTRKGFKVSQQVLKHLIPINMFMGKFPTNEMIDFYKLQEYKPLCRAVKCGNIQLLQEVIDKYRGIWIKRSLLILLDQLKVLAYRNLCKKVWLIQNKDRKIKLEIFLIAFKFSHPPSQPPSLQEICCIISNLIYLKLIQGKIFQDNAKNIRALTLSADPFKMNIKESNLENPK